MDHHHNPPDFMNQQQFERMQQNMMQNMPQQQMYYHQESQNYVQNNQQQHLPPNVNFTSFQPDPNVMAFQGQNYPPQLNVLQQNPMPLLPTEPLPQKNLQENPGKKKTPTKQKRKSSEPSPSMPFKKIPEYVNKLLEMKNEGYNDKEFAERALSNLARKIANQMDVIEEWKRAIFEKDFNSGCVCVPRPKDGRMTITKVAGSAGCKKVFPQIFVCQVFRWPNIVFHHDIKSSMTCLHPGVIKPANVGKDEAAAADDSKEVICVNPYHYDLTSEAEARFNKKAKPKTPTKVQPETSRPPCNTISDTDDDEESDDEILHYEDDGIDYAKLWDEQSTKPKTTQIQPFTMSSLSKELQFFSLNKDLKKFTPAEASELEKLGIFQELENVIKSGEYKKLLNIKEEEIKMDETTLDQELMPPPAKVVPIQAKPVEEDDDNAIQDLLEDIRGSFERQFDDEFNDLTETTGQRGNSNSETESRASSPFGNINIGPTFSMSDGHALEDLAASAEDLLASSPDEMPLEGWSMSQEVFDNFLEAATSNENHFGFQEGQQQPGGSQQHF